jgi:hypothetical protein
MASEGATLPGGARSSWARPFLASSALALLAACSGNSSGGIAGPAGTPDAFRTAEFNRSNGLEQIRGAEGYARITGAQGGAGQRVAVLDDGMAAHPDLPIVAAGTFDGEPLRAAPHGTAVGGIIAARKNDAGTHGVAFNAGLIPIQVFDDADTLPDARLTVGIEAAAGLVPDAPDLEADVINMSLGGGPFVAEHLGAMQAAAGEGKIMVLAAGNEATTDPVFPGFNAADPSLDGHAIVVGSVAADGNISTFSARCGAAQAACMVAPGEDITTVAVGGGLASFTGTSAAAPMVAGAAAVVAAAFPGVSGADVVDRLLTSATDRGAPGVDAVYGHGLLNLDRALQPSGALTLSTGGTVGGPAVGVDGSALVLGSAMSLQGGGAALLAQAVALDADGFPFGIDLGNFRRETGRATGLDSFVGGADQPAVFARTAQGTLMLAGVPDPAAADWERATLAEESIEPLAADQPRMRLQSDVGNGVGVFFALNDSSVTEAGLAGSLARSEGDFFAPASFLAPFDQLAGAQTGGGATMALGDATALTVSAFDAADDVSDARLASLQKVELAHRTFGDIELRFGWGVLREEGGVLGSRTGGAFGGGTASESQYLDLSLLAPVTERLSLFGSYTRGRGSADGGAASLLGDYSALEADAFGVGLVLRELAREGDGLSVMVGQPLRVTEGTATVTVPTGRTPDGRVLSEQATVDLAPAGREIAAETVYKLALGDGDQSLATGMFVRLNPDHDPDASPDLGLGMRYQWRF